MSKGVYEAAGYMHRKLLAAGSRQTVIMIPPVGDVASAMHERLMRGAELLVELGLARREVDPFFGWTAFRVVYRTTEIAEVA